MTRIYISLGSNIDRERHIRAGLDALHAEFGELQVSRVFESEAVGFNGRPSTTWWWVPIPSCPCRPCASGCAPWSSLTAASRMPEVRPRTLDLDLLLYGELVCETPLVLPRGEILTNAFVLWPLAELAPHSATPSMVAPSVSCGQVTTKPPSALTPFPSTGKRANCSIAEQQGHPRVPLLMTPLMTDKKR